MSCLEDFLMNVKMTRSMKKFSKRPAARMKVHPRFRLLMCSEGSGTWVEHLRSRHLRAIEQSMHDIMRREDEFGTAHWIIQTSNDKGRRWRLLRVLRRHAYLAWVEPDDGLENMVCDRQAANKRRNNATNK